jgi:hypothetical protein
MLMTSSSLTHASKLEASVKAGARARLHGHTARGIRGVSQNARRRRITIYGDE